MKKFVINLLLLTSVLILCIVVTEVFLRITDTGDFSYRDRIRMYFCTICRESEVPELVYEHVPDRQWNLDGERITINDKGLRDEDVDYKAPPGTYRILILGDSVTLGSGVGDAENYPALIEKHLQPETEIINAGVGGYNTVKESAYYFNEGYKYGTDLVILAFMPNDFSDFGPNDYRNACNPPFADRLYITRMIRSFYIVLLDIAEVPFDLALGKVKDNIPPALQSLERLKSGLDKEGGGLIIVSLYDHRHPEFSVAVKEKAGELNIPYYGLNDDFGIDLYEYRISYSDPHPDEKGHQAISRAIIEIMDNENLPPSDKSPSPAPGRLAETEPSEAFHPKGADTSQNPDGS